MERLLSLEEVCEILGVAKSTAYNWRSSGFGPPSIKVGQGVRYRPSDVEKWLEANSAQPRGVA